MTNAPRNAVEFDRVSIVFGDHPDRALPLMDAGPKTGPRSSRPPARCWGCMTAP
jgi:hypothetical protein